MTIDVRSDEESNGCQPIFFTVCDAVVLFFSQHQILQFSSNLKFCIRQGSLYSKMHFPNLAPFQVFPSFIVWCNLQGRVPSSWKNSPCVRKQRLVMLKQPKRSPDGTRSPYSKVLEDSPSKEIVIPKYVVFGGTVNENSVSAKRVTSVHNNSGSRVAKHRIDEAPFCFLFGGSLFVWRISCKKGLLAICPLVLANNTVEVEELQILTKPTQSLRKKVFFF